MFASAVGCLTVLVQGYDHIIADQCFSKKHSWPAAKVFGMSSIVLFGLYLRRVTASNLIKYNPPGLLQMQWGRFKWLKMLALTAHVTCLGAGVTWMATAKKISCNSGELEVGAILSVVSFFVAFVIEVLTGAGVAHNEESGPNVDTPFRNDTDINIGHFVTTCALIVLSVYSLVRVDDELGKDHSIDHYQQFNQVSLVAVFGISIVAALQLAGEYLIHEKFTTQTMLQTHKTAYALITTLTILSTLNFVNMLQCKLDPTTGKGVDQCIHLTGSQRTNVKAQFWAALAAAVLGPLFHFGHKRYEKKFGNNRVAPARTNIPTELERADLLTSKSGMRIGQRLSAKPKQTIELQFV